MEPALPESIATVAPPPAEGPRSARAVAPAWHTIVLVVALLAFSVAGANSQHRFSRAHGPSMFYLATIVFEWAVVGYVLLGTRKRMKLRELVGGRWQSVEDVLIDLALGVGFWVVALIVLGATAYALGLAHGNQFAETKQKLGFLVPQGARQLALFLALSATAGFCEEVIFRGYFQRQFAAFTHSVAAGLVLQALVFGAGHAYEGGKRMVLIAVYGAMFGALAVGRKSLRPGMLAHFLHDAAAGVALQKLLR